MTPHIPFPYLGTTNPFTHYSHSISTASFTTAFATAIDSRDGDSCVICSCDVPGTLEHCHIVPKSQAAVWEELRASGWIPTNAKSVAHECRNGVVMCKTHHGAFDAFQFLVRFIPERLEYVFVNQGKFRAFEQYHDKPLRLDPTDNRAPFPALFLWHEGFVIAKHRLKGVVTITMSPTRKEGYEDGKASPPTPTPVRVARPPGNDGDGMPATPGNEFVARNPRDDNGDGIPAIPRNEFVPLTPGGDDDEFHPPPPCLNLGGTYWLPSHQQLHSPTSSYSAETFPQPPHGHRVAVPLPYIRDVAEYFSVENMRRMGFTNCDDISEEGEWGDGGEGIREGRGVRRKWGETAEENVRLWGMAVG